MAGGKNGNPEPKGVKRKLEEFSITQELNDFSSSDDENQTEITISNAKEIKEQCQFCYEAETEDVNIPADAELECIVLTNDILANIYTDNADAIQHKLTNYSIYDGNGHMCSIDLEIMERNVLLHMTGYVKPIYDNSPGIEKGVAAKELGPILDWSLSPYDGGTNALVCINTEYADYLLIEPHPNYKKYMSSVTKIIHLSREVIKNILSSEYDDPTYEDILNCIINSFNPTTGYKFTEEDLISHAQFILNQVLEYDSNNTYHLPLAETQCIETLTQLSGATKPVNALSRRVGQKTQNVKTGINERKLNKATTTELVQDVFENIFAAQLNIDDKENENTVNKLIRTVFDDVCDSRIKGDISGIKINGDEVLWKDQKLCKKMFVVLENKFSTIPLIGCIEYFFKSNSKVKAHIQLFMHGYATVLGETADPREIFALKNCMNINIKNVTKVLDVVQKIPTKNWFQLGNSKLQDLLEPVDRENKNSFFYQLQYDDLYGRFEYPEHLEPNTVNGTKYCRICEVTALEEKSKVPELLEFIEKEQNISYYFKFKLLNKEYKVGSFIYLQPRIFSTASRTNMIGEEPFNYNESNKDISNEEQKNIDEVEYPELYRKTKEFSMGGSNETTLDPFEIAEIIAIYIVEWDKKNIKLIVRRMYRPEQIPLEGYSKNSNMNMILWSEEEFRVVHKNIYGLCYVTFLSNIQTPLLWCSEGPDRFYFSEKYDFRFGSIVTNFDLPSEAKVIGKEVCFGNKYQYVSKDKLQYIPSYKKIKPLNGLDIFAGCGGFSRGLQDSGLIRSNWAIERDEKSALTYKLNNPKSTVFIEDCNHLLKLAMSGAPKNSKNQNIPQKGDVDLICGSPPCQELSETNRFNYGQYSLFKNSRIVSFLSYIDFYRPKYFVMENIRNFVIYKRSMVLKLTLRCITRLGYQCTFGILQAGNFGVPLNRRSLIIMGAAPGEKLPLYPEPMHVFNRKISSLSIQIGENKFKTNCRYDGSAPMRTVTVYDAWSDLPEIPNGANELSTMYKFESVTHYQKILRNPNMHNKTSILRDHICKEMPPLVQARIELIPVCEGSDWRDLPNKVVKLSDGNVTSKLLYTYHDKKNGYGPDGTLRGVCSCASGEKCNPRDRQNNTIIPWCLPHTGNQHNNWAGLYGRIAWSGYCSTTITNPEPIGKQGRVLHPVQHRVVSVRECARLQGLKDSFIFYGSIINKHKQIGKTVPPPLSTAIGYEIIKAIDKKAK